MTRGVPLDGVSEHGRDTVNDEKPVDNKPTLSTWHVFHGGSEYVVEAEVLYFDSEEHTVDFYREWNEKDLGDSELVATFPYGIIAIDEKHGGRIGA